LAKDSTVVVTGGGVMDTSPGFQQVGQLILFLDAADVDLQRGHGIEPCRPRPRP
jgi:hypothetical protein